jgi:hypothetical protein
MSGFQLFHVLDPHVVGIKQRIPANEFRVMI